MKKMGLCLCVTHNHTLATSGLEINWNKLKNVWNKFWLGLWQGFWKRKEDKAEAVKNTGNIFQALNEQA